MHKVLNCALPDIILLKKRERMEMDAMDLNIHERSAGRGEIRRLAREGFVPGILYRDGYSTPIALERDPLRRILDRPGKEELLLDTHFHGERMRALVKEVQRDPVTQEIKHIDLMPVDGGVLH